MKIKTKIYAILATIFCFSVFNSAAAFQSGEVEIGGVGDLSNSEMKIDSIGGGGLGWGGSFSTGENSEPQNSTENSHTGSTTTGGKTGSFVRDEDGNWVAYDSKTSTVVAEEESEDETVAEEKAEKPETTDEEIVAEATEENSEPEEEDPDSTAEEEVSEETEEAEENILPEAEEEKIVEPKKEIVAENLPTEDLKAAAPKIAPPKYSPSQKVEPEFSEPEILEEIAAVDEPQKPAAGFSWKAFLIFSEAFVLLWLALFFAIAAIDRGWLRKFTKIRRTKNLHKKR